MRKALSAVAVLSSLALSLAGCGAPPSIDQVTGEIRRWIPGVRFEREEHIRLGRIRMGLVKGIVRMVDGEEDDEGRAFLREIDRVEVATYRVHDLPDLSGLRQQAPGFERRLAQSGWSLTVKAQEDNSPSWLFTRSNGEGGLRNLLVVDLDDHELTVVRMDGRLDRAFAEAVAERPKDAALGAE
ncbi:MAG TPA: DUF4252 domain-containing protein [Thermoanaerobaculia bacterium]|nr:DUF4252 domain-containing protein [Thermoanaerobaculia bacterium]